jgi:membrane-associated phospholipid phosphatase
MEDFLSISIIVCFGYPFIRYVETQQFIHLYFGLAMILTDQSTKVIKHIAQDWSPRPVGAMNCDMMCSNGSCEGKPGFPSGHAASIAFFATMLILTNDYNIYLSSFALIAITLICWSRYQKKCHDVLQLVAGCIYGAASAILFHRLWLLWMK